MKTRIILAATMMTLMNGALLAGEIKGTVSGKGLRNNADAVVYIDTIVGKKFPAPAKSVQMDQKDMAFVPHVLPVLVGTKVDFLNSDPVLHNVFSPDKCADKFNLGSWPQGQVRSFTFKKPCIADLLCRVHPEMEGFVLALPTPYFAVTNRSGAYTIRGVPDGTYTLKVWHPKLKGASRKITLAGSAKVDFQLSR